MTVTGVPADVLDAVAGGGRGAAKERLRSLIEIGREATVPPAHDRVRRVLAAARRAMGAASVSLGVWDAEENLLRTLHNEGELAAWEEEQPTDEVYPADPGNWFGQLSAAHLGVVLSLTSPTTPEPERAYLRSLGKHSAMSLPILIGGAWWGELYFTRSTGQPEFLESEIDWGSVVAAQVGAAVDAIDQLERVDRLAYGDALTGLGNRRAVDAWMDRALPELQKEGVPIGLVVADLNGLKQLNDAHGHDAGDQAIVAFARVVAAETAKLPGAVCARLGGDEFCLAVQGPATEHLVAVAEALARRGWEVTPHGVSVGVVLTTDEVGGVDSAGRLFRLADAAQYRAKRTRSRQPVVAGRALPVDAAHPGAATATVPDRRLLRGHEGTDLGHLVATCLRALDQVADRPTVARLRLVGDHLVHHLDGVGWWVSRAASATSVRTVDFALYRALPSLTPGELQHEVGEEFALADFPETAQAVRGGAYEVWADDPGARAAEIALLDDLAATGVVCAGGLDVEGVGWLLEVYSDDDSRRVEGLCGVVRLLVLAALHPARPTREMSD